MFIPLNCARACLPTMTSVTAGLKMRPSMIFSSGRTSVTMGPTPRKITLISASSSFLRILSVRKKEDDAEINVILRGVGPMVTEVRPELKIIEGRIFNPAVTEVIVGKQARAQFKGMNIGDVIHARNA